MIKSTNISAQNIPNKKFWNCNRYCGSRRDIFNSSTTTTTTIDIDIATSESSTRIELSTLSLPLSHVSSTAP